MSITPLSHESIWFEKSKCDEAERQYYEMLAKLLMKNGITYDCQETPTPTSNVANVQIENPLILSVTRKPAPVFEPRKSFPSAHVPSPKKQIANASFPVKNDIPEPVIAVVKDVTIITADSQPPQPQSNEKRFKPKEAKEKRNKADKKGRDKKIVNKDDNKGSSNTPNKNSLAGEVAKARQHIKNSLECMDGIAALATNVNVEVINRLNNLEKENSGLVKLVNDMSSALSELATRVKSLESTCGRPVKLPSGASVATPAVPATVKVSADDGDDVDLFGSESEEESEEAKKVKEARLAAYAAKKSKKPVLIAKSNIILDVKPWDDETDMKAMETAVRAVGTDGLLWGASKLVPLAYGIHKLQISCVVEDDKVSIDWLQETLEGIEDYVQSVDIAAFNKV